jgi:hypothetical protein
MKLKLWGTLLLLAAAVLVTDAHAQGNQAVLDLLLRKGLITSQDVAEVKAKLDTEMARTVEQYSKTKVAKWVDRMTFYGDLRLRIDDIAYEQSLNRPDRLQFRFRLRLGVDWQLTDWAVVGARIATGDANPVGHNQTFTDTFRKKPFYIDAAYATIQPPHADWIKLTGGKMNNPIWQPKFTSPMTYDPDLTPEGLAEQLALKFGDSQQHRLFANLGQFSAKEINTGAASHDVYLFDFEGGAELKLNRLKLTAAGGYYFTHNIANPAYRVGDSPNLGNTVFISSPGVTNYFADFNVAYGRAEAAYTLADKPFLGTPSVLTLSGEYLQNLAGAYKTDTDGWSIQLVFGDAKKKGQWELRYQYKYIEADAAWDAIADSDLGWGGTDRKGHVIRAIYNLQDWWQLVATAFVSEKISNRPNANAHNQQGVPGENMFQLKLDSTFKF